MHAAIDVHVSGISACAFSAIAIEMSAEYVQYVRAYAFAYAFAVSLKALCWMCQWQCVYMCVCVFTFTRYTLRYAQEDKWLQAIYMLRSCGRRTARRFDLPAAICLHQFADGAHTARNVADLQRCSIYIYIYIYICKTPQVRPYVHTTLDASDKSAHLDVIAAECYVMYERRYFFLCVCVRWCRCWFNGKCK